jgi:nucleoside 2-deoxyribosyltransferase
MKDHRFRVYLAGPIGGCNSRQMRGWREEIKARWGTEFDFIDPTQQLVTSDASLAYEVVEKDQRAIEGADGVLANMWRESIGTAIGVVHANTKGRPVVVVDPNWIDSRILAFYADAVERTIHDGMKSMRDLLRTQHSFQVLKRGGLEEAFSRKKLVGSLRAACRAAEVNDIVGPAIILPRVLTAITQEGRKIQGRISTTDIRQIVMSSLGGCRGNAPDGPESGFSAVRGAGTGSPRQLNRTRPAPSAA